MKTTAIIKLAFTELFYTADATIRGILVILFGTVAVLSFVVLSVFITLMIIVDPADVSPVDDARDLY